MNFLTAVKNHHERERSVGLRVPGSEIGKVASDACRGEYLMTKAVQKITLSPSRDIPFEKMMLKQSNERRIKAGVSVEDLAEDIARRCLMQSLSVRPVLADDGTKTGKFKILTEDDSLAETCSASLCTRSTSPARLCPCLTRVRPMLHDLFQDDGDSSLEDVALLDRLVTEKLKAEAETVAVEVWKWIEVALDLPYGYSHGMRSLSGDPAPIPDDEATANAKLLEEEHASQDEIPDEIDTRLGVLETEVEEIETRPLFFDAEEIGRAGAFVTLDRYGALAVYRGYDHLTSDESIEDGIIANEYTFTEGGRQFG
jgi:hypothetical protein